MYDFFCLTERDFTSGLEKIYRYTIVYLIPRVYKEKFPNFITD